MLEVQVQVDNEEPRAARFGHCLFDLLRVDDAHHQCRVHMTHDPTTNSLLLSRRTTDAPLKNDEAAPLDASLRPKRNGQSLHFLHNTNYSLIVK